MKIAVVDNTLTKLAELIAQGRFEELETDTLEIKSIPPDTMGWRERHRSACAFLTTRGGVIILGVREESTGSLRKYAFTGWQPHAEQNLKEIPKAFTARNGTPLDLHEAFPPPEIRDFLNGKVALLAVDELPADRKFVFYRGEAYKRILTGDHKISDSDVERQEEYKQEALQARELEPVPDITIEDLDVDKLNEYIQQLNKVAKIETIKADLSSALPFLHRKCFVKDGRVTTLGMLVCGKHPADVLGFRCHVHGYVDVPQEIAQDKQDLADNILPLMEASLGYILRNIQVGVSVAGGGTSRPQYPEELLRETVNNALAHRDYSINKQAIIVIKPGIHIAIRNPGVFRKSLLLEFPDHEIPLRRIIPEAKPRNPKLADVLRVYRKWEGRGIGMATLVNLCLQDRIDLPAYRFYSEEVCLYLCPGKLLDERMEDLFKSFDAFLEDKLQSQKLTTSQMLVLSYLIKSEWANERQKYTPILTPDNNHFNELLGLEKSGLIQKHPLSTPLHPIYVAHRALVKSDYTPELRGLFGHPFDELPNLQKQILGVVYRYNNFSSTKRASAKQTSFALWSAQEQRPDDIRAFDAFYRQVRYAFNRLEKAGFVHKQKGSRGYLLKEDFKTGILL